MNYSTAIFLINTKVRAISCTYETDENGKAAPRQMFKTFDPHLKVDDLVVVPTNTRHKMTVVRVVAVDVEIDFDSPAHVDWIIQTVNRSHYDSVVAQEKEAEKVIRSAENTKKRNDLRANIMADTPELQRLTITERPVIASPAPEPPKPYTTMAPPPPGPDEPLGWGKENMPL